MEDSVKTQDPVRAIHLLRMLNAAEINSCLIALPAEEELLPRLRAGKPLNIAEHNALGGRKDPALTAVAEFIAQHITATWPGFTCWVEEQVRILSDNMGLVHLAGQRDQIVWKIEFYIVSRSDAWYIAPTAHCTIKLRSGDNVKDSEQLTTAFLALVGIRSLALSIKRHAEHNPPPSGWTT